MSELPVPEDSGVSGTQVAGSGEPLAVDAAPPTHSLPIKNAVEVLAATRSRSLGGEVGASLLAGSFAQLAHDLDSTRSDLRVRDEQLRCALDEVGKANVTIATLRERLGSMNRVQNLKQLGTLIGTALIGVAVDLYKNELQGLSLILGIAGAVLLLAGWLTKTAGANE